MVKQDSYPDSIFLNGNSALLENVQGVCMKHTIIESNLISFVSRRPARSLTTLIHKDCSILLVQDW